MGRSPSSFEGTCGAAAANQWPRERSVRMQMMCVHVKHPTHTVLWRDLGPYWNSE